MCIVWNKKCYWSLNKIDVKFLNNWIFHRVKQNIRVLNSSRVSPRDKKIFKYLAKCTITISLVRDFQITKWCEVTGSILKIIICLLFGCILNKGFPWEKSAFRYLIEIVFSIKVKNKLIVFYYCQIMKIIYIMGVAFRFLIAISNDLYLCNFCVKRIARLTRFYAYLTMW